MNHLTINEWVQTLNAYRKQSAGASWRYSQPDFNILDNFPNPVLLRNPDTSIIYVNPAHEKITGFPAQEVIGRKFPYPWWTKEILAMHSKPVLDSGVKALEVTFQKKNGEPFIAIVFLSAIRDKRNHPYDIQHWVVDVTTAKLVRSIVEAQHSLCKLSMPPEQSAELVRLTPRQRKVLQLIAHGYSNITIAQSLRITPKSVENHINIIYQELGISNKPEINSRVKAALYYFSSLNSA